MDHNLDDSLNLESTMGVDFDHSEDTVVNQADITLESTDNEEGIPMEFEHIEEQPMLMDTGTEEIIDFMGEQFTLQEYSVQDHQMTGSTAESQEHNVFTTQSETMIDLQFAPQTFSVPASGLITHEVQLKPKVFTLKSAAPTVRPIAKKETVLVTKTTAPRQIAIAPKPPKLVPATNITKNATFVPGKQFAIAPKPVTRPVAMVTNRNVGVVKKMSLASAVQANAKGNTVLAQIGKQLVMVPTGGGGGGHKIKLVSTGPGMPTVRLVNSADSDQAQLISNQTSKPVMTKVFVQGQASVDPANQPAVITKLLPASSTATAPTRYVTMQQKTVPISIGNNKVLFTSPTKQSLKMAANKKQQLIAIKSPTPKLMPAPAPQAATTKKVVITTSSAQNVILKTTAPTKTGQQSKIANAGQRTQLHQINVPGKGIQYIRLVTNPTQPTPKSLPKTVATTMPSKTFVLTDSKGNLIQMTAEKMVSGQPPPLVVTGNMSPMNRLTAKPQQKLVRIAPISSKSGQAAMQARSGQSLLAPLPATTQVPPATLVDAGERLASRAEPTEQLADEQDTAGEDSADDELPEQIIKEEKDSKASLQALIADTLSENPHGQTVSEVEIEYERQQSPHDDSSSSVEVSERLAARERSSSAAREDEHPLIVIPYCKQDMIVPDDVMAHKTESRRRSSMINVEVEGYNPYESPTTPPELSESEMVPSDLALRPRKACNCTKSQCLKLYCDCFANGEFCNSCNCNNCHNNLENEELRQKAIRGCLERNPNAFRPKIGKSKTGGPEIIRRHNKGCNCKRSGCLKNYCECYEAKIACTAICKCVGCRNVEETLERARRRGAVRCRDVARDTPARPPPLGTVKQPCSFMTTEVIEAVCQCLVAAAVEGGDDADDERMRADADPVRDVIEEFARCLQDVIGAAHQSTPLQLLDETNS